LLLSDALDTLLTVDDPALLLIVAVVAVFLRLRWNALSKLLSLPSVIVLSRVTG
jgi:hypothetical protein